MRTIMLANQHRSALPHLTAVSTLFQNLLVQQASDEAWHLFHQVASLPLVTTKLEVRCIAEGQPCDQRMKRNHCLHGLVEVPFTVQIDAADQYLFDKGRRINGSNAASWWGRQLAGALKCVVV